LKEGLFLGFSSV